jgi:hypothetical protein
LICLVSLLQLMNDDDDVAWMHAYSIVSLTLRADMDTSSATSRSVISCVCMHVHVRTPTAQFLFCRYIMSNHNRCPNINLIFSDI